MSHCFRCCIVCLVRSVAKHGSCTIFSWDILFSIFHYFLTFLKFRHTYFIMIDSFFQKIVCVVCVCLCVWVYTYVYICVHIPVNTQRQEKRWINSKWNLELQTIAGYLACYMCAGIWTPASTLNHWANSLATGRETDISFTSFYLLCHFYLFKKPNYLFFEIFHIMNLSWLLFGI